MNRPVYREILDYLRLHEPGKALTLAEIKDKLFPLQATNVNYYTKSGQPEYTDYKYYPTMTNQNLRGYLNTLAEYGLIKKVLNPVNGKNVSYRSLTNQEYLDFISSQPSPTFEEMLAHVTSGYEDKFYKNYIKQQDLFESMGYKFNDRDVPHSTKTILTEKTKKFKEDVIAFLDKSGQDTNIKIILEYGRGGKVVEKS
ncbi:hypothetical protein V7O66_02035 [Methanolobus sp. ZRKC3]|uniref:hypothetical protein n=1 Tax=Methanolobus sp. ZRKC3 TaxID=3125786 RepID=UPI003251AFFE